MTPKIISQRDSKIEICTCIYMYYNFRVTNFMKKARLDVRFVVLVVIVSSSSVVHSV